MAPSTSGNSTLAALPIVPAPLADVIASVGLGVAAAQRALDAAREEAERDEAAAPSKRHTIPKLDVEIALTLTVVRCADPETPAGPGEAEAPPVTSAYAVPLDARDAKRYGYDMAAATRLKFTVSGD